MAENSTLNIDRVVEELAVLSPQHWELFVERLKTRRQEIVLRRGYQALAEMEFDDLAPDDGWLALENEALRDFEQSHENPQG